MRFGLARLKHARGESAGIYRCCSFESESRLEAEFLPSQGTQAVFKVLQPIGCDLPTVWRTIGFTQSLSIAGIHHIFKAPS